MGSFGEAGCFSFYGNKTITTGQGGMITTNDPELNRKCFLLKNHGRTERGTFVHQYIGYNFCFTDLQAAVGLAQLSRLDHILHRKALQNDLYRELLADVNAVSFPAVDSRCQGAPWFTNILVKDPQGLGKYLAGEGVETRRLFYPLHRQPCYRGWWTGDFPNTDRVYQQGLSLPSSATLTDDQVSQICGHIKRFFGMKAHR